MTTRVKLTNAAGASVEVGVGDVVLLKDGRRVVFDFASAHHSEGFYAFALWSESQWVGMDEVDIAALAATAAQAREGAAAGGLLADRLEALAKKAGARTDEPWTVSENSRYLGTIEFCSIVAGKHYGVADEVELADAELICALHTNLPAIIAALRGATQPTRTPAVGAEVVGLVKAAKPFLDFLENYSDSEDDAFEVWKDWNALDKRLTVGDFRRLAAAIAKQEARDGSTS